MVDGLAVVERFWRVREGHRPGLLAAKLVEGTEGKIEPRRELLIWRDSARLDESLRIQVTLFSLDQVLAVRLVDLPAGTSEVAVSASSHITGYAIATFDYDKGELIDQYEDFFCQSANFGVTARSTVDVLPKPFTNAPPSVDLEQRPRIHTATFPGPSGGNRSGGFDILRANTAMFELLVGPSDWRGESRWFSGGPEPQIEVFFLF